MNDRHTGSRTVRAPRGTALTCRSWLTEAPFRMIQNNLDPEVAENLAELVVYGGIGRAARNWERFDAILDTLKRLGDDGSPLVQSRRPVAAFMARDRIQFQGMPARIGWMGLGQRRAAGLAFNEMVARGELKAPIVIGRDRLDTGSVASPNRETEAMKDGSDAVSEWPLLNARLSTAGGLYGDVCRATP